VHRGKNKKLVESTYYITLLRHNLMKKGCHIGIKGIKPTGRLALHRGVCSSFEHYLEGNIPIEVMPENLEQEVKQLKVKTTEIDGLEAAVAEQ
jgi:hypothetical protein